MVKMHDHFRASSVRHGQIAEQCAHRSRIVSLSHEVDGFVSALRREHLKSSALEHLADILTNDVVVIDDKYAGRSHDHHPFGHSTATGMEVEEHVNQQYVASGMLSIGILLKKHVFRQSSRLLVAGHRASSGP